MVGIIYALSEWDDGTSFNTATVKCFGIFLLQISRKIQ